MEIYSASRFSLRQHGFLVVIIIITCESCMRQAAIVATIQLINDDFMYHIVGVCTLNHKHSSTHSIDVFVFSSHAKYWDGTDYLTT